MASKKIEFFDGFTSETTPSSTIVNGPAGDITWQGTWATGAYTLNQAVHYATDGKCYVCILNTTADQVPTDATYWDVMVEKGDTGATGSTGATGPTGAGVTVSTKGDLQSYSTLGASLGVGTNNQVLIADSAETTGLKWIDPSQTCYIKDVKADTTISGTFTTGSWVTRTLNTTSGDTGLVTLSSNVFTLASGKYEVEVYAQGYQCGIHQAKLVEDPSGSPSDHTMGLSATSGAAGATTSNSIINAQIDISASTDFSIEHRCSVTSTSVGWGIPTSFGVEEVYCTVKITRTGE